MPLLPAEVKTYPSANVATDDVSTNGGDINTAGGEIAQSSNDAFIPSVPIPTSGGNVPWYYEIFKKNTSGTFNLVGPPRFFIQNGLLVPTGSGVLQHVSDNADDAGYVRYLFKSSSIWVEETIEVDGTTVKTGTTPVDASSPVFAESLDESGGILAAQGNRSISRGISLGYIPDGHVTAFSGWKLGINGTKGSGITIANRLTKPQISGVDMVFSQAYTWATGLVIPGSLTLDAGQYIGLWIEQTNYEDMLEPTNYGKPLTVSRGWSGP